MVSINKWYLISVAYNDIKGLQQMMDTIKFLTRILRYYHISTINSGLKTINICGYFQKYKRKINKKFLSMGYGLSTEQIQFMYSRYMADMCIRENLCTSKLTGWCWQHVNTEVSLSKTKTIWSTNESSNLFTGTQIPRHYIIQS